MIICFELSMPNRASWNGKWSGEGRPYVIVRSLPFSGKAGNLLAQKILEKKRYSYSFGDGWRAEVSVREVDGAESKRLKAKSAGFSGYDWMVDSIIKDGAIYSELHPKPKPEPQAEECADGHCRFGD